MSTSERKRRFDALFASYGADIVAYCCWRSAVEEAARLLVAPENARDLLKERLRAVGRG